MEHVEVHVPKVAKIIVITGSMNNLSCMNSALHDVLRKVKR